MALLNQQAILTSLNKLSDGHTRRTAWNELTRAAEHCDAQRLPLFLACLHSTNDRYTSACRRGAVQLYGRLANMHPKLLPAHLPKITDSVVARLRDKDSTRRAPGGGGAARRAPPPPGALRVARAGAAGRRPLPRVLHAAPLAAHRLHAECR